MAFLIQAAEMHAKLFLTVASSVLAASIIALAGVLWAMNASLTGLQVKQEVVIAQTAALQEKVDGAYSAAEAALEHKVISDEIAANRARIRDNERAIDELKGRQQQSLENHRLFNDLKTPRLWKNPGAPGDK